MDDSTVTGGTGFWSRWGFRLFVGLFALAGLIAIVREVANYRNGRGLDAGHLALAIGIPVMVYVLMRSVQGRGEGPKQKGANRR